ncbi:hypothetical protein LINPERHAP1_LOCUS11415 [Linum perenne]
MSPRLFVKGKYIGVAEEVLGLNKQGKFIPLFAGIPIDDSSVGPCEACNGFGFVLYFNRSGSHQILAEDGESWSECLDCNENGLDNLSPLLSPKMVSRRSPEETSQRQRRRRPCCRGKEEEEGVIQTM